MISEDHILSPTPQTAESVEYILRQFGEEHHDVAAIWTSTDGHAYVLVPRRCHRQDLLLLIDKLNAHLRYRGRTCVHAQLSLIDPELASTSRRLGECVYSRAPATDGNGAGQR